MTRNRAFLIAFAAGLMVIGAFGQKAEAPKTYTLNTEASKAILALEAQKKECLDTINTQEGFIFVGAGVPVDSRQCGVKDGIVTCEKPKQEAAKAKP